MPPETKKTLLVLEDGRKLTDAVGPEFARHGWEVITYKDATGVMVMARQIDANVMLVDAQLRGAGALSAITSFRRNANTAGIPIIAVTGRSGPKAQELMAKGVRATVDEGAPPGEFVMAARSHELDELDFTQDTPEVREVLTSPRRLEALKKSGLLDSPPDGSFDRLAYLATRLILVPAALANFIAADRQFYKASAGVEGEWKERRGTPLSHAFCQWVVAAHEPLVVNDTRTHRVLRSNPAVEDLGVVAYAGVPLVGDGGQAIGSICAVDHQPRSWSKDDVETLMDLALIAQAYAQRVPEAVQEALQAVTRMMRRYGRRLRDDEREELLRIIDEQTALLAAR
jgi:CheY-like chemotaxis protein